MLSKEEVVSNTNRTFKIYVSIYVYAQCMHSYDNLCSSQ